MTVQLVDISYCAAISENPTLGKTYYIHDHLGSVRVAVKQNGLMSNSFEYEPFGELNRRLRRLGAASSRWCGNPS